MTQPIPASSTIQEVENVVIQTMEPLDADQIWETFEARGFHVPPEVIRLALTRGATRTPPDSPTVASSSCVSRAHARDGPARLGLRGRIGHRWVL
jgi:hypothetical protein